jgi:tRNA-uridine 2-sulfurtransferase
MPIMPIDIKADTKHHGKILTGMSGGVDSSVASLILAREGYEVIGLSLLTCDEGAANLADAQSVCRQIGIEWHSRDVRGVFREKVIANFLDEYLSGRTPNPCVICNPLIKFAILLEEAARLGCDAVATGHYARIVRDPDSGRLALGRTTGSWKDQSYFLYRLSQDQLGMIKFPLSGLEKPAVREIAASAGILRQEGSPMSEKPDSQDICFIHHLDYAGFIQNEWLKHPDKGSLNLFQPGPVVNKSGQQIGTHRGLIHYTVGQRKGFSVQTTDRLFVLEIKPESGTLVVGQYEDVLKPEINVKDVVYSGLSGIRDGERLEARIRSSAREASCQVFNGTGGTLHVVFDHPAAAPAPGQSCVFYRDGLIMAGGVIISPEDSSRGS